MDSSSASSQFSDADDEYEKLVIRMNPPRVTVDNTSSRNATLVKVDSANKHGILLEVVQVLTDLNLTIRRAYISSDGEWFMDVFHVVDQYGNKLSDGDIIDRIQQSLQARENSLRSLRRSVGVQSASEHTSIELTGRDRPGLLSEVFAVLADLKCNVVGAEVWTHNSRLASVVYITDEATGGPITDVDADRLARIKRLLRFVLKGDNRDPRDARAAVSAGGTHTQRRLHQMMYEDRDYADDDGCGGGVYEDDGSGRSQQQHQQRSRRRRPSVTVEDCPDKGYSVVSVRCRDRPKLLFDTVCTLTDMKYVVFHATVVAEGAEATQEYFIRHLDGCPVSSEGERQRLVRCLEAAISRRTSEGIRLELRGEDRVGLLSDVTRIFREHGLAVTRAEVATRGTQAVNVFYVADSSGAGQPVRPETIEAVRREIGLAAVRVKEEEGGGGYQHRDGGEAGDGDGDEAGGRFSLGSLFRSGSEKFLSNLGLVRSFS